MGAVSFQEGGKYNTVHGETWRSENTPQLGYCNSLVHMTIFTIVPDQTYSSITLHFSIAPIGNKQCYWDTVIPDTGGSTGNGPIIITADNDITLTGPFTAGVEFNVYVWSLHNLERVDNVTAASYDGESGGGLFHLDEGSAIGDYQAYIDNGSAHELYAPYIDNGSSWEECV